METELILSIGGLPPLSARGCKQNLIPIQRAVLRRTLGGQLISIGPPQGKYRTIIQCEDKTPLATEGFYPGIEVTVGCIQRLSQKVEKGESIATLERPPLKDSIVLFDQEQSYIPLLSVEGRQVSFAPQDKITYMSYRPWLTMRLIHYTLETDEWGMKASWSLELEEI